MWPPATVNTVNSSKWRELVKGWSDDIAKLIDKRVKCVLWISEQQWWEQAPSKEIEIHFRLSSKFICDWRLSLSHVKWYFYQTVNGNVSVVVDDYVMDSSSSEHASERSSWVWGWTCCSIFSESNTAARFGGVWVIAMAHHISLPQTFWTYQTTYLWTNQITYLWTYQTIYLFLQNNESGSVG